MKWKCQDGREIEIKAMTASHLKNTIALIRRKGGMTVTEFNSCIAYVCSPFAGECASMALERELADAAPCGELEALEEELANRTGGENE